MRIKGVGLLSDTVKASVGSFSLAVCAALFLVFMLSGEPFLQQ